MPDASDLSPRSRRTLIGLAWLWTALCVACVALAACDLTAPDVDGTPVPLPEHRGCVTESG